MTVLLKFQGCLHYITISQPLIALFLLISVKSCRIVKPVRPVSSIKCIRIVRSVRMVRTLKVVILKYIKVRRVLISVQSKTALKAATMRQHPFKFLTVIVPLRSETILESHILVRKKNTCQQPSFTKFHYLLPTHQCSHPCLAFAQSATLSRCH